MFSSLTFQFISVLWLERLCWGRLEILSMLESCSFSPYLTLSFRGWESVGRRLESLIFRSSSSLLQSNKFLFLGNNNNNKISVFPQVEYREGNVYADFIPTFKKAERLFPVDPWLGKDKRKGQ